MGKNNRNPDLVCENKHAYLEERRSRRCGFNTDDSQTILSIWSALAGRSFSSIFTGGIDTVLNSPRSGIDDIPLDDWRLRLGLS